MSPQRTKKTTERPAASERADDPRGDGRRPDQLRPTKIETGVVRSAEGSARVSMGDTVVLCAATIEERVPGWMKGRGEGWVTAE